MNRIFKNNKGLYIFLFLSFFLISSIIYITFIKPKTVYVTLEATKIVNNEDTNEITLLRKYRNPYIIKVSENNDFYLVYYMYSNENFAYTESKITLSRTQYEKLEIGKMYWLEVRLNHPKHFFDGTLLKIYEDDPLAR